jgi:anthranilate phosphoribosyltransferase
MREFSTKVPMADTTGLLDIVGTGGDGAHTFNISTTAMFVAAAAARAWPSMAAAACRHRPAAPT